MHNATLRRLGATAWMVVLGIVLVPSIAQAQTFKVIAHPDAGVTEMTRAVAQNLFLKKELKLPGGKTAAPVDLVPSSAVRESFSKDVLGRATTAVVTYWQQQIFSGKEIPPPTKPGDAEILEYVRNTPGAIGYVSAGATTSGVVVVKLN